MRHSLVCHSDTPSHGVTAIDAELTRAGDDWAITFFVEGADAPSVPPLALPERTDGLWQHTCFELFVMPGGGPGYLEFNFSLSMRWAAYAFDRYRAGMRDLPLPRDPAIDGLLRAKLTLPQLDACAVALTAVIEERDGTKSYWALRHPRGAPDFHHSDGFVLQLS